MTLEAGLDPCGLTPQRWADLALRLKADLARRMRSRNEAAGSLLDWGRRYLPGHFRRQPSGMHRWLAAQLDEMTLARGARLNVIGPRGAAKSTVATLAHVLRVAVEGWEPYVWILSDTKQQAWRHLENIKLELLDNQRLAAAYPDAVGRGPVWRGNSIQLRNGVSVEAFGCGQGLRGRRYQAHRPTLIVCDDLENDGHRHSATLREQSRDWFQGTLLKAGTKRTNIVNLATALHRDALALQLDRTPGWTARVFAAIERWPDNMQLWHEWEAIHCDAANAAHAEDARAFFERHRGAMEAGTQLLWPDEEDLYTLMRMRVEGGRTAFEREKQGMPLNPDLCEWPEAYFGDDVWFDKWPAEYQVRIVALDPSQGRDTRRSDYSAFAMVCVDRLGVIHVEADLARRTTHETVSTGAEICRAFHPDAFGVETNQFQQLLAGQFEEAFQRQGIIGVQPWSIDNRVNKRVRIRRLGPYLAARRVRFKSNSPGTRLLVEQLQEFPVGDHDDGPDALEMAIRLAGELLGQDGAGDGLGDRLPLGGLTHANY
jgi:predicted phage terminase large subunit-like protein